VFGILSPLRGSIGWGGRSPGAALRWPRATSLALLQSAQILPMPELLPPLLQSVATPSIRGLLHRCFKARRLNQSPGCWPGFLRRAFRLAHAASRAGQVVRSKWWVARRFSRGTGMISPRSDRVSPPERRVASTSWSGPPCLGQLVKVRVARRLRRLATQTGKKFGLRPEGPAACSPGWSEAKPRETAPPKKPKRRRCDGTKPDVNPSPSRHGSPRVPPFSTAHRDVAGSPLPRHLYGAGC
jgi:hypothetical protein